MDIDIGESIIERNDFAACRGCPRLVHIGLGPSEVVRAGPHEIGDSEGNGVINRAETSGRDLLFEPFPLVGGKPDVHAASIYGPQCPFQ
jgi:hypothetical protein